MRIWIAALFMFLLASQVLPLSVLEKTIAKVQLSVDDDDDTDGEDGNNEDGSASMAKLKKRSSLQEDDVLHYPPELTACYTFAAAQLVFQLHVDQFPVPYAGEVATPPPNFC